MTNSILLQGINTEILSQEEEAALAVLTHLKAEELDELKNVLHLGMPGIIGPQTLASFKEVAGENGIHFTPKGINAIKELRGIGSPDKIGPDTARGYIAELKLRLRGDDVRFVAARFFKRPSTARQVKWIVIHSMETPQKSNMAEAVAEFFHGGTAVTSAHYCIDNDSIVQCVKDADIAFAAPGANTNGLHLEHAGRASQTASEWQNAYSTDMLRLSARLVAVKAQKLGIPTRWLEPEEIRAGEKGIASHHNMTLAFGIAGGHTDPGPNFPVKRYLRMIELSR